MYTFPKMHAFAPMALSLAVLLPGCSRACSGDGPLNETKRSEDTSPLALSEDARSALGALGYVTWSDIDAQQAKLRGTTLYDTARSYKGLNYYCSENSGTLQFVDMVGNVVHSVQVDLTRISRATNMCKLAKLYDSSSLVMLVSNYELVRVDLSSRVLWQRRGDFHHDLDVATDGAVVSLARRRRQDPIFDQKRQIIDNEIVTLDPHGQIRERLSMAQMVARVPPLLEKAIAHTKLPSKRPYGTANPRDVFHMNSIEVVDETVRYEGGPSFEPGDLLFCSRHLDAIGVIDGRTRHIKWHWGTAELQWPHHASLLPNGNIMVFDNGVLREASRVLVVSPSSGEIVWKYEAEPPADFFSPARGAAQLLPNGNVLITDSPRGHVFEVTEEGDKVWEFWNPDLSANESARATIYRMARLSRSELENLNLPDDVRTRLRESGY